MISLFRKIRKGLLKDGNNAAYLKYAVGEVFLVVVGILIALQIDNWNKNRIEHKELGQIQQRIILDIDNDIQDLSSSLIFWKEKEPIFNKVINDSITIDLLDQGLSRLIGTIRPISLNKVGVEQLKRLKVKDPLSLGIIDVYDRIESIYITPYQHQISEMANDHRKKIKEKYEWFPEWISKTIMKDNSSKELQSYFLTNPEYRNEVSNAYQLIYGNYVRYLEFVIPTLENLRTQLKRMHDDDFVEIDKESLAQFTGTFEIVKIDGADFGLTVKDIYQISAKANFIRITQEQNPRNFYDFYYSGRDSFYYSDVNIKIDLAFELDSSGNFNGYKLSMDSNQDKSAIYATKHLDVNE